MASQTMVDLIAGFRLPPVAVLKSGNTVRTLKEWRERREEILTLLEREMYGTTPLPCPVEGKITKNDNAAYSNKAVEQNIELYLFTPGGMTVFPFTLIIPKVHSIRGVFVNIAFMITTVDGMRYCPSCPIEEILDEGFALAIWDYLDVTSDDGDFNKGIAGVFSHQEDSGWGKLGMWAYSMSRVTDYLKTLKEFANTPFAAISFSRLGKAALWAGAQDERLDFVMPFGSGTGGVGFTRRNRKESITELQDRNWFWFCKNFRRYKNDADSLPFDQHFAIAACAPRKFMTSISQEDEWTDVENEYLSCFAASEGYLLAGGRGFIAPDKLPYAPVSFLKGDIALGLRHGTHFLSRADWRLAMEYIGGSSST
jgi:hypothetical protein